MSHVYQIFFNELDLPVVDYFTSIPKINYEG